ncbi:MAG: hypothetical protein H7Z38_14270 [Rubrivivax sp.]|nr:hypothetical protein [Pyrinomonadaceae bacterium]
MSNDQSPPARKVIPYKKGGRRPSPFSEMAFQYSGTALDVAIQQREQDGEELPPEVPARQESPAESVPIDTPVPEAQQTQSVSATTEEPPAVSTDVEEEKPQPPPSVDNKPVQIEKQPSPRSVRLVAGKEKSKPVARVGTNPDLQAFVDRWKPFLTDTQLGICTYIYNNSTAINLEYCFTSTAKLMAAVSKTERQVKTVLNQLLVWELVIKGETVINAPREKRGTFYKLNPDKS